jgi:hypothetical protein
VVANLASQRLQEFRDMIHRPVLEDPARRS